MNHLTPRRSKGTGGILNDESSHRRIRLFFSTLIAIAFVPAGGCGQGKPPPSFDGVPKRGFDRIESEPVIVEQDGRWRKIVAVISEPNHQVEESDSDDAAFQAVLHFRITRKYSSYYGSRDQAAEATDVESEETRRCEIEFHYRDDNWMPERGIQEVEGRSLFGPMPLPDSMLAKFQP